MTPFVPDLAAIDAYLHAPGKPVAKYIFGLGDFVQAAAKRQVGTHTRALQQSISTIKVTSGTGDLPACYIGSPLSYARLHHEGTRPHLIYPDRARVLRFSTGARIVYARVVRHPGTRPNHYLVDPLLATVNS